MRAIQPAVAQANGTAHGRVSPASGWTANPLRGEPGVRPANYLQPPANPQGNAQGNPQGNDQGNAQGNPLSDPFGDSQLPSPAGGAPAIPPSTMPQLPPSQQLPNDPLSDIELPPAPGGEEVQAEPVSPFDRQANPKLDPLGGKEPAPDATNAENSARDREDLKIPNLKKNANTPSCNDLRERVRHMRLSDISLDVSPKFGEGLRAREAGAQERLDFAASAPNRDWTDYTGTVVASGRMVDLRDDRVVLDVNGREQMIPVRDLSDIDVAYVADVWNLPLQCSIGYEAYAGRQFTPSAVEWKASGLCHKPLYFEDVQLERYGHEVGPVLQPLLSSAHFFGNMLILPYKMGIHPPGECQYPLGYYRPGDCAPYMIQPFPFSLRGAAMQAGFVTGAGALIP